MALASSLQKTASKLMGKFGGALTYRRVVSDLYNTETGSMTQSTTDYALRGVLQDINAREVNDLVQATDKKLTVAATDLAVIPTTADRVVISGIVHQIISIEKVEQDNQAIIYTLTMRA
jgi:hypothetical protein